MNQLQEQYLFLAKYNIHTKEEMLMVQQLLLQRRKETLNEKSKAYKDRYPFKCLFEKLSRMEELKECEECFQDGDEFFEEEHKEYAALEKEITLQGYTSEEVKNLRNHFSEKIREINIKDKEMRRKIRIADSIIKDFSREDDLKARIMEDERKEKKEKEKQDIGKEISEQPPIR